MATIWQQIAQSWQDQPLLVQRLAQIALYFGLAYMVHLLTRRSGPRIVGLARLARRNRTLRTERVETLRGLLSSSLSFLAFALALLFSLALFAEPNTIVWLVGLFGAGFGFAARPFVSDVLTGVGFLFSDPYDVGEKVELMGTVQGVVESVNLSNTVIRSHSGEVVTVPNGEIRLIRNYSRGRFSLANVVIKVASTDLEHAIELLETLSEEAMSILPNLIEPFKVISRQGVIGEQTELDLIVKTRFARAAELRPRLLSLVHERLTGSGVHLGE